MEPLVLGLALLGAALLLIVVEVFVPSAGLITMVAVVLAIAGVFNLFRVGVGWGVTGLLAMLLLGPLVGFFALQMLPSTPMGRRMMGIDEPPDRDGDGEPPAPAPDPAAALVGAEGVVATDLRPVGSVRVGSQVLDAISETGFVHAGSRVRIVSVEGGGEVRVRPIA